MIAQPVFANSTPFNSVSVHYYQTMAGAAAAGNSIIQRAGVMPIAVVAWRVSRKFKNLVRDLDELPVGPDCAVIEFQDWLTDLHRTFNRLVDIAAKHGLFSRTLTAGSLQSIKTTNDDLLDLLERLRIGVSGGLKADLKEAVEEFESGKTISLDALFK